ncbi:MAG: thermonuclease family protein [bacterium]|nr:thermonuclease family protein [bacterium]
MKRRRRKIFRWFPLLIVAGLLLAERMGLLDTLTSKIPESLRRQRQPCLLVQVVDGDTVAVLWKRKNEHLRLLRVDTPERGEWGHEESADSLKSFLTGKDLQLEFENAITYARDRYGRLLAYLFANGENVNVEMVRAGWSRFWTKYGRGRYERDFEAAEEAARAESRGIWKDSGKGVDDGASHLPDSGK